MSTEELKSQINQYHETLVKERKVKKQLIAKLEAIQKVVNQHVPSRIRSSRTPSKAGGIPFGVSSLAKSLIFMNTDNTGDAPSNAESVLLEIRKILRS